MEALSGLILIAMTFITTSGLAAPPDSPSGGRV